MKKWLKAALCVLLATAAPECTRMVVAFTMDKDTASDGHVFASQRRSAAELTGWLRQRGIPEAEARLLLQHAFVNEVLRHVDIEHLHDRLSHLVEMRFRGELGSQCHGCRGCGKK